MGFRAWKCFLLLSAESSSPFDQPITRLEKDLKSYSFKNEKILYEKAVRKKKQNNSTWWTWMGKNLWHLQVLTRLITSSGRCNENSGFVISILLHHCLSTFKALGRWSPRQLMVLSMKESPHSRTWSKNVSTRTFGGYTAKSKTFFCSTAFPTWQRKEALRLYGQFLPGVTFLHIRAFHN